MAARFRRLDEIYAKLATTNLRTDQQKKNKELPNFYWDRMIRNLVLAGFGDYETAANADIIDAAVFLLLGNDKHTRAEKWLNS